MTSRPLRADRPISQGPSHPSKQVTQRPETGATSTLVVVKVAALRFGLLRDMMPYPPFSTLVDSFLVLLEKAGPYFGLVAVVNLLQRHKWQFTVNDSVACSPNDHEWRRSNNESVPWWLTMLRDFSGLGTREKAKKGVHLPRSWTPLSSLIGNIFRTPLWERYYFILLIRVIFLAVLMNFVKRFLLRHRAWDQTTDDGRQTTEFRWAVGGKR